MFRDPKYSFSMCQKKLCSNLKLIFFTKFNLIITHLNKIQLILRSRLRVDKLRQQQTVPGSVSRR